MFFRNLSLFRLASKINAKDLDSALQKNSLQPCAAHQPNSIGWLSPVQTDVLAHVCNQQILIALGIEEKLLPASVVRQHANERAKAIEEAEGRRVGRKELRDIREALTIDLLQRAFVRRRTTYAWIDPVNMWIGIDTGTQGKAEELLEHLRKSFDEFPAALLKTKYSPSSAMTGWIAANEAPPSFTIDDDCELRSAENGLVRYTRHSLEGDDIREHIASGKIVSRLGLTWNDRISFVLNEKLQIKRLSFLDILKEQSESQAENEQERFDLDFTLMTGELSRMLSDLSDSLGGEVA